MERELARTQRQLDFATKDFQQSKRQLASFLEREHRLKEEKAQVSQSDGGRIQRKNQRTGRKAKEGRKKGRKEVSRFSSLSYNRFVSDPRLGLWSAILSRVASSFLVALSVTPSP